MLFDNDPAKIGAKISEFIVQDSRQLIPLVKQAGIKVAMLTVPPAAAQSVAEELVQAGVTAILNYTPMPLNLPKHIKVQNIDPIIQLQHMTYYLD